MEALTPDGLAIIVASGESETVEFKRSTGQLDRAARTLCAFLNGLGGRVFLGVTQEGKIVGQQVADSTLRDVAAALSRFEPASDVQLQRVMLRSDLEVLVLDATPSPADRPFTYDGRAYQRVGTTTSAMPQTRYQGLLLERAHAQSRWENAPAAGCDIAGLDVEEILRTVRQARTTGRLAEAASPPIEDVLDRFGSRTGGRILNAAVVLFGTRLQQYPQCRLRLARFRGAAKDEFLDERQIHRVRAVRGGHDVPDAAPPYPWPVRTGARGADR